MKTYRQNGDYLNIVRNVSKSHLLYSNQNDWELLPICTHLLAMMVLINFSDWKNKMKFLSKMVKLVALLLSIGSNVQVW